MQPALQSPSGSLLVKRPRVDSGIGSMGYEASSMFDIPELPEIHVRNLYLVFTGMKPTRSQGEMMLDVFTHRSVRFAGAPPNEDFGDSERLGCIGQKVLALAVTSALFHQRPMLNASMMEV